MGYRELKRRTERIEAAFAERERQRLGNGLFRSREPLPAGTVVPAGSKVVTDVYYDTKIDNTPAAGMTFYMGYLVERVTSDPCDYGRAVPAPEAGAAGRSGASEAPAGGNLEPSQDSNY